MSVLTSKMTEQRGTRDGNPNIISRKSKGVVHEKSVKMQLLQITMAIKPRVHIWIEMSRAKYERPHFKNERDQLTPHRQPYHYIEES